MNPAPPRSNSTLGWLPLVLICLLGPGGCQAYQFGAPTMHRFEIRSVHVPMVETDSFRKFLGPQLTEALVKQIELDTPYLVTSAARADSFLVARIRFENKRVLAETINDDARLIQVGMRVEATWVDRNGAPLMQRQVLRVSDDVDFIPESGQSLTTAQTQLTHRLAKQIVDQMEISW